MIAARLRDFYYRLSPGLRRAMLVRRRSSVWIRSGIVFIHIPKAAGTSINQALYGRFMGHVRASDVARWGSAELKALPSFAVTRNPWDRLVSAYRFAKRGSGIGGAYQAGMWQEQQYRVPEFETFERFVNEWLAPRDLRSLDHIFQPQSLFVCDGNGAVLVDHVGRLEDLAPTYAFIRKAIGTTPAFEPTNRSGEQVDYRSFFTPSLAQRVGQLYRDDVQRFGYDF